MRLRFFKTCAWLLFIVVACVTTPALCQDDAEGEDGQVEEDSAPPVPPESVSPTSEKDLDEEEEVATIKSSPDADTTILFTKPYNKQELPAGQQVKLLVGFRNKGKTDFIVETVDASFRYPMDFSYYIRNYTHTNFERSVVPSTEATFDYSFWPAEDLAGRPFGLTILLTYRDSNGTKFQNAVFNETIQVIEDESGFNPETGFLYIFFGCVVVLLLVLGQQFLKKMRRKHGMTKKAAPIEMGTTTNSGVDMQWIPKELLQTNNKSPKPMSPKKSPHQRKNKKAPGTGSSED